MANNHNNSDGDLKWGAILPLIGGFAIGNEMATGNKPQALFTYDGFQANESHLRAYWPEVPYLNLDEGTPTIDRLDFNKVRLY